MRVKLLGAPSIGLSELASIARLSRGVDPTKEVDLSGAHALQETKDYRTLLNCYRRGHLSVFEFTRFTFFIEAPIYVLRQIMRYRTGSYLERSLRYCEPMDSTYIPELDLDYKKPLEDYKELLRKGVKKERARLVLPLATRSQVVAQYNLRTLFHIFDERLAHEAQEETRELVSLMYECIAHKADWALSIYETKKEAVQ